MTKLRPLPDDDVAFSTLIEAAALGAFDFAGFGAAFFLGFAVAAGFVVFAINFIIKGRFQKVQGGSFEKVSEWTVSLWLLADHPIGFTRTLCHTDKNHTCAETESPILTMDIESRQWDQWETQFRELAKDIPLTNAPTGAIRDAKQYLCLYGENGYAPDQEFAELADLAQKRDLLERLEVDADCWQDTILFIPGGHSTTD